MEMMESAPAVAARELTDGELAGVDGGISPVSSIIAGSGGWGQSPYRPPMPAPPRHPGPAAPRQEPARPPEPREAARRGIDTRA